MASSAHESPAATSTAACQARLVSNERVSGGCHVLRFEVPGHLRAGAPGQFAMLSTAHPEFPLLPRPFSLLGWTRAGDVQHAEFLIMPVGRGSRLLCGLVPGEFARLNGPLGHRLDEGLPAQGVVGVAGGYGVAPFVFLIEHWARAGDERACSSRVLFGARTAERLSLAERLQDSGCRVQLCTDDGSAGREGRVDAALASALTEEPAQMVLCCGPEPMMEAVGVVARAADVPARASLETFMGCGYAVCNGCAVAVDSDTESDGHTYVLACREGTLFDSERLHWKLI